MSLRVSPPLPRTLPVDLDESSLPARLRSTASRAQLAVAAAILPMLAVTLWFGLTCDHLEHPVTHAVYRGALFSALMAVGVYWWARRPAGRFGLLLVLAGVLVWIASWQGANAPLLYDIGVLAEAPTFVLAFYLPLAFPMGRVEPPAARWLIAALWILVLCFFLPWALLTPAIAGSGPLARCLPACPANVLRIGDAPGLVNTVSWGEIYGALAVTVATLLVYGRRVRRASRPQRRAMLAVAVTSMLYLPAYFVTSFSTWILKLDPSTLDAMAWGAAVARLLFPVGFLVALLQADHFAARALQMLLNRLVARPTPERWRDAVADALDDPRLRLGYHDAGSGGFQEAGGTPLEPPSADGGGAWVPIEKHGQPVAAMLVDETLTEDPELVRAAALATLVALENGALEGELRETRTRVHDAERAERERIGRDLHDSAQQRLIALRIRLALLGEQLGGGEQRQMVERLDDEVGHTMEELRDIASGVTPPLLASRGVVAALRDVARHSPVRVSVYDSGIGRPPQAVETAIYFCCLECLQNAAKHAGPDASVSIHLARRDGRVSFSIEDDGMGFDPADVDGGAGLGNLATRVAAVGGFLEVRAREGRGTRVTADVPV